MSFPKMSEALLSCSGLSVRFGGLVALDALDLEVGSGAIVLGDRKSVV